MESGVGLLSPATLNDLIALEQLDDQAFWESYVVPETPSAAATATSVDLRGATSAYSYPAPAYAESVELQRRPNVSALDEALFDRVYSLLGALDPRDLPQLVAYLTSCGHSGAAVRLVAVTGGVATLTALLPRGWRATSRQVALLAYSAGGQAVLQRSVDLRPCFADWHENAPDARSTMACLALSLTFGIRNSCTARFRPAGTHCPVHGRQHDAVLAMFWHEIDYIEAARHALLATWRELVAGTRLSRHDGPQATTAARWPVGAPCPGPASEGSSRPEAAATPLNAGQHAIPPVNGITCHGGGAQSALLNARTRMSAQCSRPVPCWPDGASTGRNESHPSSDTDTADPVLDSRALQRHQRYIVVPSRHRALDLLHLAVVYGAPVLLQGEPATGKRALLHFLAKELKRPITAFYWDRLGFEEDAFLDAIAVVAPCGPGRFQWRLGPVGEALAQGHWLVLEGLGSSSATNRRLATSVVQQLASIRPGAVFELPGRNFALQLHQDFRLFAIRTGTSASLTTTDETSSSWIGWLVIDLPPYARAERHQLLGERFPTCTPWIDRVLASVDCTAACCRKLADNLPLPGLNEAVRLATRLARTQEALTEPLTPEVALIHALDVLAPLLPPAAAEDKHVEDALLTALASQWSLSAHEARIWWSLAWKQSPLPQLLERMAVAPTETSCTALGQLYRALDHDEPVLLIGETGVGKTFMVQELAKSLGRRLVVLNMSQQSDLTELFGGYQPIDTRKLLQDLAHELEVAFSTTFSTHRNQDLILQLRLMARRRDASRLVRLARSLFTRVASSGRLEGHQQRAHWDQVQRLVSQMEDAYGSTALEKRSRLRKRHRTLVTSTSEPASGSIDTSGARKVRWLDKRQHLQSRSDCSDAVATALDNEMDDDESDVLVRETPTAEAEPPLRFAFREGLLALALRRGDLLLLDELNLAPAACLERLTGVLDSIWESTAHSPTASLPPRHRNQVAVLSASSSINRHPAFRLVACMNPETNIGRKALPASLQRRFTTIRLNDELPDEDLHRLVEHLFTKRLHPSQARVDTEHSLTKRVVLFYQRVRGLARSSLSTAGDGTAPRFPLRTLSRMLRLALHLTQCGLDARRALYEGACLGFSTFLAETSRQRVLHLAYELLAADLATPERHLLTPVTKLLPAIPRKRPVVDVGGQWLTLVQPGASPASSQATNGEAQVPASESRREICVPGEHSVTAASGAACKQLLTKGVSATLSTASTRGCSPTFVCTRTMVKALSDIARALVDGLQKTPVLIEGATAVGKTALVKHLAERTGHELIRLNQHEHTDVSEYLGRYLVGPDGCLRFVEGPLVRAARHGHWVLLDELNLAPGDVLESINRLLDENRELIIPETGQVVQAHSQFALFATQNPSGSRYGGRKMLSPAFRSRFVLIHLPEMQDEELLEILGTCYEVPASFASAMVRILRDLQLRRCTERIFAGTEGLVTARDLFRWANRRARDRQALRFHGRCLLVERLREPAERNAVWRVLCQHIGLAVVEESPRNDARTSSGVQASTNEHAAAAAAASVTREHTIMAMVDVLPPLTLPELLDSLPERDQCPWLNLFDSTGADQDHEAEMPQQQPQPSADQVYQTQQQQQQRHHQTGNALHRSGSVPLGTLLWQRIEATAVEALGLVMVPSLQCVLGLALHAILNQEPVLLIGETGIGKSTVCAVLAAALNRPLYTLNGHRHTEAADLVGRYVPVVSTEALNDPPSTAVPQSCATTASKVVTSTRKPRFKWQDGALTSAMRQGAFLLIDEINMIDDAVVERLNSVLEPAGKLVLSEHGGEPLPEVQAAPGFGVFACMNPSGDFGKKELSAAIRNRFTEIWIPYEGSCDDLFPVAAELLASEPPLVLKLWKRALEWLLQRQRMLQQPAMSIRDLVACIRIYRAQQQQQQQQQHRGAVVAALYEALEAFWESAWSLSPVSRLSLRNELQSLFQDEHAVAIHGVQLQHERQVLQHQRQPVESTGRPSWCWTAPTVQRNLRRLERVRAVDQRPVLLEGPPGVGKTQLVLALAETLSKKVHRVNLSEFTEMMDLVGTFVPHGSGFCFRRGPLYTAMERGDWILVDELNLASQSVLEGLNAVLDHRRMLHVPELALSLPASEGFRFFATQNPAGTTLGRRSLPRSFLNRFWRIPCDDYDAADYEAVLRLRFPSLEQFSDVLQQLTHWWPQKLSLVHAQPATMRDVLRLATLWNAYPSVPLRSWAQLLLPMPLEVAQRAVSVPETLAVAHTGRKVDVAVHPVFGKDTVQGSSPGDAEAPGKASRVLAAVHEHATKSGAAAAAAAADDDDDDDDDDKNKDNDDSDHAHRKGYLSQTVTEKHPKGSLSLSRVFVTQRLDAHNGESNAGNQVVPTPGRKRVTFEKYPPAPDGSWWSFRTPLPQVVLRMDAASTEEDHLCGIVDPVVGGTASLVTCSCWQPRYVSAFREQLFRKWLQMDPCALFCRNNTSEHRADRATAMHAGPLSQSLTRDDSSRTPHSMEAEQSSEIAPQFQTGNNVPVTVSGDALAENSGDAVPLGTVSAHESKQLPSASDLYIGDTIQTPDASRNLKWCFCWGPVLVAGREVQGPSAHGLLGPSLAIESVPEWRPCQAPHWTALAVAVTQRWPCLLVGPASCGKASLVQGMAQILAMPLTEVVLSNQTDITDLFGGYSHASEQRTRETICASSSLHNSSRARSSSSSARQDPEYFIWRPSRLLTALEQGHWLLLRHVEALSPALLDRLNPLLEEDVFELPVPEAPPMFSQHDDPSDTGIRRFVIHPRCRIFLTATCSEAAAGCAARQSPALSEALMSRCLTLWVGGSAASEQPVEAAHAQASAFQGQALPCGDVTGRGNALAASATKPMDARCFAAASEVPAEALWSGITRTSISLFYDPLRPVIEYDLDRLGRVLDLFDTAAASWCEQNSTLPVAISVGGERSAPAAVSHEDATNASIWGSAPSRATEANVLAFLASRQVHLCRTRVIQALRQHAEAAGLFLMMSSPLDLGLRLALIGLGPESYPLMPFSAETFRRASRSLAPVARLPRDGASSPGRTGSASLSGEPLLDTLQLHPIPDTGTESTFAMQQQQVLVWLLLYWRCFWPWQIPWSTSTIQGPFRKQITAIRLDALESLSRKRFQESGNDARWRAPIMHPVGSSTRGYVAVFQPAWKRIRSALKLDAACFQVCSSSGERWCWWQRALPNAYTSNASSLLQRFYNQGREAAYAASVDWLTAAAKACCRLTMPPGDPARESFTSNTLVQQDGAYAELDDPGESAAVEKSTPANAVAVAAAAAAAFTTDASVRTRWLAEQPAQRAVSALLPRSTPRWLAWFVLMDLAGLLCASERLLSHEAAFANTQERGALQRRWMQLNNWLVRFSWPLVVVVATMRVALALGAPERENDWFLRCALRQVALSWHLVCWALHLLDDSEASETLHAMQSSEQAKERYFDPQRTCCGLPHHWESLMSGSCAFHCLADALLQRQYDFGAYNDAQHIKPSTSTPADALDAYLWEALWERGLVPTLDAQRGAPGPAGRSRNAPATTGGTTAPGTVPQRHAVLWWRIPRFEHPTAAPVLGIEEHDRSETEQSASRFEHPTAAPVLGIEEHGRAETGQSASRMPSLPAVVDPAEVYGYLDEELLPWMEALRQRDDRIVEQVFNGYSCTLPGSADRSLLRRVDLSEAQLAALRAEARARRFYRPSVPTLEAALAYGHAWREQQEPLLRMLPRESAAGWTHVWSVAERLAALEGLQAAEALLPGRRFHALHDTAGLVVLDWYQEYHERLLLDAEKSVAGMCTTDALDWSTLWRPRMLLLLESVFASEREPEPSLGARGGLLAPVRLARAPRRLLVSLQQLLCRQESAQTRFWHAWAVLLDVVLAGGVPGLDERRAQASASIPNGAAPETSAQEAWGTLAAAAGMPWSRAGAVAAAEASDEALAHCRRLFESELEPLRQGSPERTASTGTACARMDLDPDETPQWEALRLWHQYSLLSLEATHRTRDSQRAAAAVAPSDSYVSVIKDLEREADALLVPLAIPTGAASVPNAELSEIDVLAAGQIACSTAFVRNAALSERNAIASGQIATDGGCGRRWNSSEHPAVPPGSTCWQSLPGLLAQLVNTAAPGTSSVDTKTTQWCSGVVVALALLLIGMEALSCTQELPAQVLAALQKHSYEALLRSYVVASIQLLRNQPATTWWSVLQHPHSLPYLWTAWQRPVAESSASLHGSAAEPTWRYGAALSSLGDQLRAWARQEPDRALWMHLATRWDSCSKRSEQLRALGREREALELLLGELLEPLAQEIAQRCAFSDADDSTNGALRDTWEQLGSLLVSMRLACFAQTRWQREERALRYSKRVIDTLPCWLQVATLAESAAVSEQSRAGCSLMDAMGKRTSAGQDPEMLLGDERVPQWLVCCGQGMETLAVGYVFPLLQLWRLLARYGSQLEPRLQAIQAQLVLVYRYYVRYCEIVQEAIDELQQKQLPQWQLQRLRFGMQMQRPWRQLADWERYRAAVQQLQQEERQQWRALDHLLDSSVQSLWQRARERVAKQLLERSQTALDSSTQESFMDTNVKAAGPALEQLSLVHEASLAALRELERLAHQNKCCWASIERCYRSIFQLLRPMRIRKRPLREPLRLHWPAGVLYYGRAPWGYPLGQAERLRTQQQQQQQQPNTPYMSNTDDGDDDHAALFDVLDMLLLVDTKFWEQLTATTDPAELRGLRTVATLLALVRGLLSDLADQRETWQIAHAHPVVQVQTQASVRCAAAAAAAAAPAPAPAAAAETSPSNSEAVASWTCAHDATRVLSKEAVPGRGAPVTELDTQTQRHAAEYSIIDEASVSTMDTSRVALELAVLCRCWPDAASLGARFAALAAELGRQLHQHDWDGIESSATDLEQLLRTFQSGTSRTTSAAATALRTQLYRCALEQVARLRLQLQRRVPASLRGNGQMEAGPIPVSEDSRRDNEGPASERHPEASPRASPECQTATPTATPDWTLMELLHWRPSSSEAFVLCLGQVHGTANVSEHQHVALERKLAMLRRLHWSLVRIVQVLLCLADRSLMLLHNAAVDAQRDAVGKDVMRQGAGFADTGALNADARDCSADLAASELGEELFASDRATNSAAEQGVPRSSDDLESNEELLTTEAFSAPFTENETLGQAPEDDIDVDDDMNNPGGTEAPTATETAPTPCPEERALPADRAATSATALAATSMEEAAPDSMTDAPAEVVASGNESTVDAEAAQRLPCAVTGPAQPSMSPEASLNEPEQDAPDILEDLVHPDGNSSPDRVSEASEGLPFAEDWECDEPAVDSVSVDASEEAEARSALHSDEDALSDNGDTMNASPADAERSQSDARDTSETREHTGRSPVSESSILANAALPELATGGESGNAASAPSQSAAATGAAAASSGTLPASAEAPVMQAVSENPRERPGAAHTEVDAATTMPLAASNVPETIWSQDAMHWTTPPQPASWESTEEQRSASAQGAPAYAAEAAVSLASDRQAHVASSVAAEWSSGAAPTATPLGLPYPYTGETSTSLEQNKPAAADEQHRMPALTDDLWSDNQDPTGVRHQPQVQQMTGSNVDDLVVPAASHRNAQWSASSTLSPAEASPGRQTSTAKTPEPERQRATQRQESLHHRDDENDKDDNQDIAPQHMDADHTRYSLEQAAADADLITWFALERSHEATIAHLSRRLEPVLEYNQMTRFAGDFRTGKRLHMRRLIDYVASNYTRDRIWMRRIRPDRRRYDIVVAVDDSASMHESGASRLALESLVVVAAALQRLELAHLGVIRFGCDAQVVHSLHAGIPAAGSVGDQLLGQFTFQQQATNVVALLECASALFREAREQQAGVIDSWQLLLILSDGRLGERDALRALIREANAQRLRIVFFILDQVAGTREQQQQASSAVRRTSVLDMKQVGFAPGGRMQVRRYLEDFPFPFYVIVEEIAALPTVFGDTLRQWLAAGMDSGC